MKHRSLRKTTLALLLSATAHYGAAQQTGFVSGSNVANGTALTQVQIDAAPSPACPGVRNVQVTTPGTPFGQNYGGVDTYFSLPAGNGAQTFALNFQLAWQSGTISLANQPTVQVFVDGALCSSCTAQITTYLGSTYNALGQVEVTHHAGYAWDTDGIHEFGLRFTFPPQGGPSMDIRFKAVMEGTSFTDVLGTYDAPALPLLILRDPPGDGSFSSLSTTSATCLSHSRSVTSGTEEGGWFKMKLGVAGEAGFIVTTAFEFSVEAGVSINATQTATSEFEYETCLETTEEFTTADDGTPDDVFIGSAVRYKYGMATVIERPTCGTVTKHAYFVSAPDSTLISYNFTESYILETVIPQLEEQIALFTPGTPAYKKAVNQRDVWVRTLEINSEIKATAPLETIREFNGGGIGVEHTQTTTTSQSTSIDYTVSLETGLSLEFGLEVGGNGISGGGDMKMRSEYGNEAGASNTVTNTMAYTLRDGDVFDNLAVEVRKDAYFGTYAFVLDSANSRTSCRYEGGYALDQPSLSVGAPGNTSMTVNEAIIGTAVNFPLVICNESDTTRTYYLRFSAVSNSQGAVLQALGNTLNSNDDGIPVELLGGQCITANLSLTQPNAGVLDFPDINLYLYSLCDEEYPPYIRSYVTISAHYGAGNFGSYCIPTSATGPAEGDWVDGVQIGAINNMNTGGYAAGTYTDYSDQLSTALPRGSTQLITLTGGAYPGDFYAAWIDYDHSGTFEPVEKLGQLVINNPFESEDIAFLVPNTAALGSTLLRVRCAWNVADMDACVAYDYGETEDYAVVINANTPQDCQGLNNGPALPGTACNDGNAGTGNDTWNANCVCIGIALDCAGVPGGPAIAGTACDDGNANTADDAYDNNCACVGIAYDCTGFPGGPALPGTACDDGDGTTGDDTWSANCQCAGLLIDCMGNAGGPTLPGTACDDGNPLSGGDAYDANCECVGSFPVDCTGVPNGPAQPGNPCDDGDSSTGDDVYSANCVCAGEAYDCAGDPGGTQLPGTPCDDGNPESTNDVFTVECSCLGQLPSDCAGVPGGSAQPGTPCVDDDPQTGNDTWNAFCECVGEYIDCEGVPGGFNLPGAPCNDGDPETGGDSYSFNCVCAGQPYDCEGVPGGMSTVGTPCDDGNSETSNDLYNANCICAGTLANDCEGVAGGPAQPGTSCDDGNLDTGNDVYNANCICAGELIDCQGTIGGAALPGTACDDGDNCTVNDAWSNNCSCSGTTSNVGTINGPAEVEAGESITLFIDPIAGASGYSWDLPAGWSSDNTGTFVLVADAGSLLGPLSVCVNVTVNGCVITGCVTVTVTGSTGVAEIATEDWFTVRPNPSNGLFNLVPGTGHNTPLTLVVYDATGREVLRSRTLTTNAPSTLDLSAVEVGTYYLMATRESEQRMLPLVVAR